MGLGRTGLATALQQGHQERQADGKELHNLAQRMLAAIDSGQDTFAEVDAVRTRDILPSDMVTKERQYLEFCMLGVCRLL